MGSSSKSRREARGKKEDVRRIWRGFFSSLVLVAVLVLAKIGFEHTTYGEWLKWATYDLIQTQLSSDKTRVAIIDISDLKTVYDPTSGLMITPRQPLLDLLNAIVNQKPLSVGIDVDFSPVDGHFVSAGDPDFFQKCLDLEAKKGVPIFLGVFRSHYLGPKDWLGGEQFSQLAATYGTPKGDATRTRVWLEQTGSSGTYLPSLGAALAGYKPSAEKRSLLSWAVQSTRQTTVNTNNNIAGEQLVDYGKANALKEEAIPFSNPLNNLPKILSLAGKAVILGDVAKPSAGDTFVIPGIGGHDEPAPGVLVHACAAETLLASPLCELTDTGHLLLDLLLSVAVLGGITAACLHAVSVRHEVNLDLSYRLLNGLAIMLVLVFGLLVVKITRVVWDDFLLVIAALLLHRPCEHWSHAAMHWFRHTGKAMWEQIFPEKK